MIVNMDDPMHRAINGSFPIKAVINVLRERILSKGYQSRSSKIPGRLTAIGLLMRARMKKAQRKKVVSVVARDLSP